MSKEIAVYNEQDLAVLSQFDQDQDFGSNDLSYAWLGIAQVNSPKAMKSDPSYVPGLEPGMFYNSLTGKVYGASVKIIYLKFTHTYSAHEPDGKNKFIRALTEQEFEDGKTDGSLIFMMKGKDGFRGKSGWYMGNELIKDANNYFVMLPDFPEDGVLRLSLGAGAVKHVKAFNTMLSNTYLAPGKKAPKFSFVWELTLALEQKPDGSYFTIGSGARTTAQKVGPVPSELLSSVVMAYQFFQGLSTEAIVASEHTDEETAL